MSHKMTILAMKQQGLKPSAKVVLYWLAEHHNSRTEKCFPSLKTLMAECEMGKTTLIRQLNTLEAAGLIKRSRRTRANGSHTSTAYQLNLTPLPEWNGGCSKTEPSPGPKRSPHNLGNINLGNEPKEHDHRKAAIRCQLDVEDPDDFDNGHQRRQLIPTNKEKTDKASKRKIVGRLCDGCHTVNDEFELVWVKHPRKVGKGAARKAWEQARAKAGFMEITGPLAHWIRLQSCTELKYIPHFSTWLNEERWNDDQTHAQNRTATTSDRLDRLGITSTTNRRHEAGVGRPRQLPEIELKIRS